MNRYLNFKIILFFFALTIDLCAQEKNDYYKKLQNLLGNISEAQTLMYNQVQYTKPKGFDLITNDSIGKETLSFLCSKDFHFYLPQIHSKLVSQDKDVIIFIYVPPVYSKDSVYIDMPLATDLKIKINTYHIDQIKADFYMNTGKRPSTLQGLPIHYQSVDYAQKAFNADTVITYPLKMWKKYENKYNHCQVMMIQKNKRGLIQLICVYNQRKQLKYCLKEMERIIWYRNPEDFIDFLLPKDTTTVFPIVDKSTNKQ